MNAKFIVITLMSALLTACASQHPYGYDSSYGYADRYYNNGYNNYGYNNRDTSRVNSALIGGGVGAVAGAALSTAFDGDELVNAGLGALAGGAVGAAVGAYVEHQHERQNQQQQNTYYNGNYYQ